jgi:uncharacterized protein YjiS (DUF1127 family)
MHFVRLCIEGATRFAQNCARALAANWHAERTRRELLAFSDHTLKDIGISRSEIWAAAQAASRSRSKKGRSEKLRHADINASNWQHCTGIARRA